MKKLLLPIVFLFVLLSAFKCENEPLEGEFVTSFVLDCNTTTEALTVATSNFEAATDNNYTILCNAYKFALLNQIAACNDPDGSLQETINNLEDCVLNIPLNSCQTAVDAVNIAQLNFENASSSDYEMFCNTYKTALEVQIAVCGDTSGDIQTIIDSLGDCTN